ncbi:MAG: DNA modification methylase [Leucobacter sp.]
MKTRLVTSIALAAVVSLGFSGCALISPQATLQPYSPSDGVETTVAGLDVRNLMLITDAEAEELNIVFTAVNNGENAQRLGFSFVSPSGSRTASAEFLVEPGSTIFGDPEGEAVFISLPGVIPGSTVTTYVQTPGGDAELNVPVIDGTLQDEGGVYAFPEYRVFVP